MKVKLTDLETREATSKARDNFNKWAAAEKFEQLARSYRLAKKMGASVRAADEMIAMIENGITFKELELWLLEF